MMDNELREILHDCVQNAMKGSSGYLDSAAFDTAEQAIRAWCVAQAPEKHPDAWYGQGTMEVERRTWDDAIDAYVRKVRGE